MVEQAGVILPNWITTSGLLGALLAIDFAIFLLFILSRNNRFLWLGIFVLGQVLAQGMLFAQQTNTFPMAPTVMPWMWIGFSALSYSGAISFTQQMLGHKNYSLWHRIALAVLVILVVMAVTWWSQLGWQAWLFYVTGLSVIQAGLCLKAWRIKVATALWLASGWLLTLACYGYAVLDYNSAAESPLANAILMLVLGSILVTALWFTAVLKQFIEQKTAMLAQQQQALADAKAHEAMQQEMLTIEEDARETLEAKVQERTFELEVTLRELQEANKELEEKNTQDALTSIRNRRFFDKKYQAEFRRSRREQTELSLIMLDIDHFKKVNDNYGHLAGDDVIRFVGRTIADILKRPSDEACRYGGEEFALILPSTDLPGATKLAEMIRKTLADAAITTDAGVLNITVSCGVYTAVAELEMQHNQYIELADKALYHAKQSGRNKVVHYHQMSAQTLTNYQE